MNVLDPAEVPADDRGLLLGDGVFDTVRVHPGGAFRLEAHLDRLEGSARTFGIPVRPDLRTRVAEALRRVKGEDAVLRVALTRGSGPGVSPPAPSASRLLLWVRSLDPARVGQRIPLRARRFGWVNERARTSGHKTIGYLERIQALRDAREAGADEALLRNARGEVVSASAANVLAVLGRTIVAPGPESGALPGITRAVVLEAAREAGFRVEARGLTEADLDEASELVATSSLRGPVPVVEVDGRGVGSGASGPVFRALARSFDACVLRETGPRP